MSFLHRILRPGAPRRAEFLGLFALALGIRLVAMFALDTPGGAVGKTPWAWGAEQACLGTSLLEGRGFGDPWAKGSGASAWLTPAYPGLLALAFSFFDGVGRGAATFVFVVQSVADAATALLLMALAGRMGWARAARPVGLAWALYPLAIWNAVGTVWDTTLVATALTGFVVLFLRGFGGGRRASLPGTLGLGCAYGAVLMLNPAPMVLAPVLMAWVAGWRPTAVGLRRGLLFSMSTLAVVFPWMLRNKFEVDSWNLRDNLGVELMIGNHSNSIGRPEPTKYHPSHIPEEFERYRLLGESEYSKECQGRALAWIEEHPREFLSLVLLRTRLFWLGEPPTQDRRRSAGSSPARDPEAWIKFLAFGVLGIGGLLGACLARERLAGRWFWILLLAMFSAPYALTHVSERYRFPIDPVLVLLSVGALFGGDGRRAADEEAPGVTGGEG